MGGPTNFELGLRTGMMTRTDVTSWELWEWLIDSPLPGAGCHYMAYSGSRNYRPHGLFYRTSDLTGQMVNFDGTLCANSYVKSREYIDLNWNLAVSSEDPKCRRSCPTDFSSTFAPLECRADVRDRLSWCACSRVERPASVQPYCSV